MLMHFMRPMHTRRLADFTLFDEDGQEQAIERVSLTPGPYFLSGKQPRPDVDLPVVCHACRGVAEHG